jgi:hypothetical protein
VPFLNRAPNRRVPDRPPGARRPSRLPSEIRSVGDSRCRFLAGFGTCSLVAYGFLPTELLFRTISYSVRTKLEAQGYTTDDVVAVVKNEADASITVYADDSA